MTSVQFAGGWQGLTPPLDEDDLMRDVLIMSALDVMVRLMFAMIIISVSLIIVASCES